MARRASRRRPSLHAKEFVKKYIDLLALHKLNTLHLHLTDDQGWRLEITRYPRLTEVGAWRKETLVGRYRKDGEGQYDGTPYGGFYTQADMKSNACASST